MFMNAQSSKMKIKSYKHDGQLHRMWHHNTILQQTDQTIIGINDHTKVTESNGTVWTTKVPAIFYFHSEYWFNIVAMLKENGIHYYCNLSSPFIIDGNAIQYIDYDLDIRVYPDDTIQLLDEDEYLIHKEKYQYPIELDTILNKHIKYLYDWIENKLDPFSTKFVYHWYNEFHNMDL